MKWLHTIGSLAIVAVTILTPELQSVISAHPAIAAGIAAVYAILGQFAPHTQTETQAQSKPLS